MQISVLRVLKDQALELYLQQYHPTYYQGYYYSKPVAKGISYP